MPGGYRYEPSMRQVEACPAWVADPPAGPGRSCPDAGGPTSLVLGMLPLLSVGALVLILITVRDLLDGDVHVGQDSPTPCSSRGSLLWLLRDRRTGRHGAVRRFWRRDRRARGRCGT